MNNVKLFNTMLNSTQKNSTQSNLDYKNKIENLIKQSIKNQKNSKTCCIIGAGKLNDLPINMLVETFEEVLLTDIDIQSTIQSIKAKHSQIKYNEVEYTGFEQSGFFDDFINISKLSNYKEIDAFIESKIKQIEKYTFLSDQKLYFDFVYVSPIYTQLIYNQVLYECTKLRKANHPEHLVNHIEQAMLNQMPGVIERFNLNICEITRKSGILLVISDIFEYKIGSPFAIEIEQAIHSQSKMNQLYSSYVEQYGMGLGDFGLFSMSEICELQSSKWLIWPLMNDKQFVVKCNIYQKNV